MFELLRETTHTLKRRSLLVVIIAAVVAGLPPAAWADGMIVPVDPEIRVQGHWAVKYHHVDIRVRQQVASVSIEQEFVNTGGGMIEVEYLFPVPPDAAIDSMTLMVDGKEFAAKLLEADEARRIYEDIVRKKRDPALLEYAGFGLYRTRAFPLEAGKPVKVVVTYKCVCKKSGPTVEVWYPLNTEKFSAKAIESVTVRVDIEADADITNVYSPSHEMTIDRETPRRLVATYHGENVLPTTDLQLFYSSADVDVGATLLTFEPREGEDGYFLMLVSPNPRTSETQVAPKDIVLVLDRSGSMGGEKIIQARAAARFVLERLNAEDRFNVIAYNDGVDVFFDGLVLADEAQRKEAIARLDQIDAAGGTNIYEALQKAMTAIGAKAPQVATASGQAVPGRPKYVVFLTDGLPTVGNTNESVIIADTANANKRARLFAFGVGYDVNVRLLDKLAGENRGRSDYVKPAEPIEAKVSALYAKIKNPVMIDLKVSMHNVRLTDVYPRELGDLFEGDQLVVTGRYSAGDVRSLPSNEGAYQGQLVLTGTYAGEQRGFEYPVTIIPTSKAYPFAEKLWAIRRVGWLLDQIQLNGESEEVIGELVKLSLAHGIMTPYTSFLADETTDLARPAELHDTATSETRQLQIVTGGEGQVGASNRGKLNQASRVAPASAPADAPDAEGNKGVRVYGSSSVAQYEADEAETVTNVRQVGNQALYQRGRQWVAANASEIDPERDAEQIEVVERMTDEYFELTRLNTADENRILASQAADEELLIALRGQVYLIK